jgi:hypothetical protein
MMHRCIELHTFYVLRTASTALYAYVYLLDAVDAVGYVCVPVEHEARRVSVSAHILPHEPVPHVDMGQQGRLEGAHLVQTVAGGSEHRSGD